MGVKQWAAREPRGTAARVVLVLGAVLAAAALLVSKSSGCVAGGFQIVTVPRPLLPQTLVDAGQAAQQQAIASLHQQAGPGMLEALQGCETFACLRKAHDALQTPRNGARFNFPHFFIIGYHKAATTSLHGFLEQHGEIVGPEPKEPQFFTEKGGCQQSNTTYSWFAPTYPQFNGWGCDPDLEREYIVSTLHRDAVLEAGLHKAAFEASADSAGMGKLVAMGIRKELPWLKLVVTLREPISREISGRVHTMDEVLQQAAAYPDAPVSEADACLLRLHKGEAGVYECLRSSIARKAKGNEMGYASLQVWLNAYPREQIHVIQYENLTAAETHTAVLDDMQRFLGLDPEQAPKELPRNNSRKGKHEGWPMKREEYETLLQIAKPQAYMAVQLLEQYGYTQAAAWLPAWEAAWQRNLDSCYENGDCMIQLT